MANKTNENTQFSLNPVSTPAQQVTPYMLEYMQFMENIMSGGGPSFFNYKDPVSESVEKGEISLGEEEGYNFGGAGEQIANTIQQLKLDDEDKEYLLKLGYRESGLDPSARAKGSSFRGLYQFNNDSLKTVGINPKKYDTNIMAQFEAALKYRAHNLAQLKNYQKYIGEEYKGITITANGMAAAAHLLGAATVADWFDDTRNSEFAKRGFKDGNGTSITEYFKMFAPARS